MSISNAPERQLPAYLVPNLRAHQQNCSETVSFTAKRTQARNVERKRLVEMATVNTGTEGRVHGGHFISQNAFVNAHSVPAFTHAVPRVPVCVIPSARSAFAFAQALTSNNPYGLLSLLSGSTSVRVRNELTN